MKTHVQSVRNYKGGHSNEGLDIPFKATGTNPFLAFSKSSIVKITGGTV